MCILVTSEVNFEETLLYIHYITKYRTEEVVHIFIPKTFIATFSQKYKTVVEKKRRGNMRGETAEIQGGNSLFVAYHSEKSCFR